MMECISFLRRCIWRRFFQLKEEEEEEQLEVLCEILEESTSSPITNSTMTNARKEFLQDHYRSIQQPPPLPSNHPPRRQTQEQQRLSNPNLNIPSPDGSSYLTMAQ